MPTEKGFNLQRPSTKAPNRANSTLLGKVSFKKRLALFFILTMCAGVSLFALFFKMDQQVNRSLATWTYSRTLLAKVTILQNIWAQVQKSEKTLIENNEQKTTNE